MKLKVLSSNSSGNAYILEDKDEILLIECGVSFKKIKEGINFDLNKVVGVLISHEHKDHSKVQRILPKQDSLFTLLKVHLMLLELMEM